MALLQWLSRHFQIVDHIKHRKEVILTCPQCSRPKLYFSLSKRVGYCHYAKCQWHVAPPKLKDLVAIVGYGPEEAETTFLDIPDPEPIAQETSLPEDAQALCTMKLGRLYTSYPMASQAVAERGVEPMDQFRFGLAFNGNYIYIPIYSEGKMMSYLGRKAWWYKTTGKRYDNASGTYTSHYLFNWDEARAWPRLTLVENTFNAIWLRDYCQTVSTFGSRLSDKQAKLIASRPFESVALLWDEGTSISAGKAVERLKTKYGLWACQGIMTGQPDGYSLDWLMTAVDDIHTAAKNGEVSVCL